MDINHVYKKMINREPMKTQDEFLQELYESNPYVIPLDTYTKSSDIIQFKCIKCNHEFPATIGHVLYDNSGCPKCNLSKGEKIIASYLDNHNIDYISQKMFDDCRDTNPLPFDFYLPKYNMCIEYDGEQHFNDGRGFFKSNLSYIQNHDNIKNQYCLDNNISLLRIPYTQYKDVKNILNEFIK